MGRGAVSTFVRSGGVWASRARRVRRSGAWDPPVAPAPEPVTIMGTRTPGAGAAPDSSPVTVATYFTALVDGNAVGGRFWNAASIGWEVTVGLWDRSNGALIASATAHPTLGHTGWVVSYFPAPVPLTAGGVYAVGYFTPSGGYTSEYTPAPVVTDYLSTPSGQIGRFDYGPSIAFPEGQFADSYYWTDVLFVPAAP